MGCIQPLIKDLCMFPTPIDLAYPVTNQIYFKNCGLVPITWSVDREKIERYCNNIKINKECIDVLEDGGKLESNQTTFITILFKPYNSSIYNISIPIISQDSNKFIDHIVLQARSISYNPNVLSIESLNKSSDAKIMNFIPNNNVPKRRISNSQLLTAAILSNEEIRFDDFSNNQSSNGLTFITNISKR